MAHELTVLVVDDELEIRQVLQEGLTRWGHRVAVAESGAEALTRLRAGCFEVLLLDIKMPGLNGLDVLKAVKAEKIDVEVVILTGYATVEDAVTAMKVGAFDYLQKPFVLKDVAQVLSHAAAARRLKRERLAAPVPPDGRGSAAPVLLGVDPKILGLRTIVERVAPTDVTVLITGESGTGKELMARLIHARSARATGPLVAVDCPSVPVSLFESELFGHERGAFTGAVGRQRGKVEQADGGTLFLDEVGELPLEVQAKVLRFLQERKITRLGGSQAVGVDVRVISATNRDLAEMVEKDAFRRDLFHRLNVVQIDLPPLQERPGDVPLLVAHFVEGFCRELRVPGKVVSPEGLGLLVAYQWPGNVRELENVIQHACVLTPGQTMTPESFPARIVNAVALPEGGGAGQIRNLPRMDRWHILEVLRRERWNMSRAARILGIHRATLYRKIVALGIRPDRALEKGTS